MAFPKETAMPAACTTSPAICLLFAFSFLFLSCNTKNGDKVIKEMEGSLEASNKSVNMGTEQALHSLQQKTYEPGTIERAEIWFPKAERIFNISKEVFDYLEKLKAGSPIDINGVFETLKSYKDSTMTVDSSILLTFSQSSILPASVSEIGNFTKESFNESYFGTTTALQKKAILTKLQNDIRITENKIVNFCNLQVGHTDGAGYMNVFSSIAVANTNYAKPGEKIEITAGIGAFSTYIMPSITINNKKTELNDWGAAVYSFKASSNPGKHYVPVKIEYTDQNGMQQVIEKTIEYTVAKPCDQ